MKSIGVLGGLGPQATMDFEERIHRAAQDLIPQKVTAATHRWWFTIIDIRPFSLGTRQTCQAGPGQSTTARSGR